MPRMGVIVCPAWKTIAEPTLSRSLPMVAYLNLGYIRRLTDSGYFIIYLVIFSLLKRRIYATT
jgi:hypothetical protein